MFIFEESKIYMDLERELWHCEFGVLKGLLKGHLNGWLRGLGWLGLEAMGRRGGRFNIPGHQCIGLPGVVEPVGVCHASLFPTACVILDRSSFI